MGRVGEKAISTASSSSSSKVSTCGSSIQRFLRRRHAPVTLTSLAHTTAVDDVTVTVVVDVSTSVLVVVQFFLSGRTWWCHGFLFAAIFLSVFWSAKDNATRRTKISSLMMTIGHCLNGPPTRPSVAFIRRLNLPKIINQSPSDDSWITIWCGQDTNCNAGHDGPSK